MTRYPAARWRPISRNFTDRKRTRTDGIILHVTASTAASQHGWFNNPSSGASSHLHIALDGTVEQYVDLDKIAWTSGDGSARTIGIETAGTGSGSWTKAQLDALEDALVWLCERYRVPVRLMESSRPTERGIGWHRLGIDGNFPASGLLAGRTQRGGGEKWSKSRGKVCPGDARIRQIPALVERVAARLTEDDMPLTRADADLVVDRLLARRISHTAGQTAASNRESATIERILGDTSAGGFRAWKDLPALRAELAATRAALVALAQNAGVDARTVERIVREGVDKALSDISITLTSGD